MAAWLKSMEQSGARVSKEELEFHAIQVSGNWAPEWASEHQVVETPGKPPIEGYGKIALVLRHGDNEQAVEYQAGNVE